MNVKTKRCVKCEEVKKEYYFSPGKGACNKCKREKIKRKIEKFESVSLGIDELDTGLSKIQVLGKYFKYGEMIDVESAIAKVNKGIATVYSSDTIYMRVAEKDPIIQEEVLERDDYTCHYCGKLGFTVDHIIPKSKGGEWTHNNLVCCCKECNFLKGDLSYEEFVSGRTMLDVYQEIEDRKRIEKLKEKFEKSGLKVKVRKR